MIIIVIIITIIIILILIIITTQIRRRRTRRSQSFGSQLAGFTNTNETPKSVERLEFYKLDGGVGPKVSVGYFDIAYARLFSDHNASKKAQCNPYLQQ